MSSRNVKSYVFKETNAKLENEIVALKANARPVIEVNDQEVQTDVEVTSMKGDEVSTEKNGY